MVSSPIFHLLQKRFGPLRGGISSNQAENPEKANGVSVGEEQAETERRSCQAQVPGRPAPGVRGLDGDAPALLTRIEETDRPIDEIVYKLYGLTDEEIGIVEQAVG